MYLAPPHDRINLKIGKGQHAALKKLSRERNQSVQSLIASGIAAVTGVPDDINRYPHRSRRAGGET